MKKFISFLVVLSAVLSFSIPAFASDIAVRVDGRTVTFREEPKPTVINDRTYVPLRRVLEFMGAKVSWDGENRVVTVTSYDNINILFLTIDNPEITAYTFTSVTHADKNTIVSDVAPIILNDRTMLPIRVIAEALGSTVDYDERGIAEITTKQTKKALRKTFGDEILEKNLSASDAFAENLPKLSIDSDAKDIKEGDTVNVYVKISDLDKAGEEVSFRGLVTTILYDAENFAYEGFTCVSNDGKVSPAISADNGSFYENGAKIIYILQPENSYEPKDDGTVAIVEFTALSNNGGTFSLSDGISEIGYDNEIVFKNGTSTEDVSKYNELYIDKTEITVK